MNDTTISFTIPLNDPDALNRVSLMLSGLANDASNEKQVDSPDVNHIPMNHNAASAPIPNDRQPAPTTITETTSTLPDVQPDVESTVGQSNVELDAEGLPWDARIHSSTKNKTKVGVWKVARGKDKDLVAQVKAELKKVMAIPAPEQTIKVNTGPGVVEEVPVMTTPPAPPVETTPTPPPVEVKYIHEGVEYTRDALVGFGWNEEQIAMVEVSQPAPAISTGITFPMLMKKITSSIQSDNITQADVDNVLSVHGVGALPLLSARPDLVPIVDSDLFG